MSLTLNERGLGFIDDRADGPLIINEMSNHAKKAKRKMFLFKVDFDKAFDSISWKYLESVMFQMGFGAKWWSWIKGCLSSSRASVLINGSATKEFSVSRGVRQGDPLSPFLFIIAMEGLSVAMNTACHKSLFNGVSIPNQNSKLSHLLYADDALFVGEWTVSNFNNLARILRCFHAASGLKINFHKSQVYGIGVTDGELNACAHILGCEAAILPFKYLGVPVGANMSLKRHWQPIIDCVQNRLSSWKVNSLSFGGRLTLSKSVLGSLPIYFFSLFKAPNSIIDKLEKLRHRFLWSGNEEKNKISWVAWNSVLGPKEKGGLDIGSLGALNLALLVKWVWRLKHNPEALWSRVISGIHNCQRKNLNSLGKKSFGGPCYNISRVFNVLQDFGINISDVFEFIINSGESTLFWTEDWTGEGAFEDRFPSVCALDKRKSCFVADRIRSDGTPSWHWKKTPRSIQEVNELQNLIDAVPVSQLSLD